MYLGLAVTLATWYNMMTVSYTHLNYLQVGYYTEVVFPKKGVRFIAINNSVDSANPTDNDLTPFLRCV